MEVKPSLKLDTTEKKLDYIRTHTPLLKEKIEIVGLRNYLLDEKELDDHTITLEEHNNILKLKELNEDPNETSEEERKKFLDVEEHIFNYIASEDKQLERIDLYYYLIGALSSHYLIKVIMKMLFLSTINEESNPQFSKELKGHYEYLLKAEKPKEKIKKNIREIYLKNVMSLCYKYNDSEVKASLRRFIEESPTYTFNESYLIDALSYSTEDNLENAKINTMATNYLESELKTLALKYNVNIELTDEQKEDIEQYRKDTIKTILSTFDKTEELNKERVINIYNISIKSLIKTRKDLEELSIEEIRERQGIKPRKKKKKEYKDPLISVIENDMKKIKDNKKANPLFSGWVKVKSDPVMAEIHENRQKLGNYEDKRKYYESKINELESKKKKTENDTFDLKFYKGQLEALNEEEGELKKQLEQHTNNLKELAEKLSNITDLEEKHKTEALIRFNKDRKEAIEKRLNKGNNYLTMTLEGYLESETKNVKGIIPISKYDVANYSEQGEIFLEYAENQLYYFPQSKYIYIDPKEFTEYQGRNPSSYRAVKKDLLKDLNNMYENERYVIKHKVYRVNGQKIELNNAKISLISDILPMKIGRKEVILVALGETCKNLITTYDSKKWASIPYHLNQLTKENNTAKLIGKWLYKDIRRNLKGDGDYQRTLTFKYLVDTFIQLGILNKPREKRYSEDIIIKLEDALKCLSGINTLDIKFITYDTKAFDNYKNIHKGKKEEDIITAFEEESITITFHTLDTEAYDPIRKERNRHRKKTLKEKYSSNPTTIAKIRSKEYDSFLEEEGIEK